MNISQLAHINLEEAAEWPLKHQLVFLVLLFVFIQAIASGVYLYPKIQELETAKQQQAQLKVDNLIAGKREALFSELGASLLKAQKYYRLQSTRLIGESELAALPTSLSQMAFRHQLLLQKIESGQAKNSAGLIKYPVNFELTGNYHQLGKFVQSVSELPKIVHLQNVRIERLNADSQKVRFIAKACLYQFDPEEQNPALPGAVPGESFSLPYSETVPYTAQSSRVPFFSAGLPVVEAEPDPQQVICDRPPQERLPELFAEYPAHELRVKGLMGKEDHLVALLQAPDGLVEIVSKGRVIGSSGALVSEITTEYLLASELVSDGAACWQKRDVKLAVQ
ncbi:pilus assembly protein PilP [Vibrio sp. JC009]|uniref:pilus assembly protein PilP n=1 Tax=Vibrio sp. JC009 TaxID=2912314 RepID=UPI0023B1855A|nr:pilus assembly protein PilP [Vibrio sp. JC009]WED21631.1 pilus assembly protein PilP [Vibrio sp. JC009]